MKPIIRPRFRPFTRRRGVTLVEMLVTLAMLVIIMTVLVQVFAAATGALSSAQALQQIDDQLRRVDGLLHSDLEGVTATFTPPLEPEGQQGLLRVHRERVRRRPGRRQRRLPPLHGQGPRGTAVQRADVGVGRIQPDTSPVTPTNLNVQPVTITSNYAEIIYFLRNGNLYRRVLLIAPELQSTVSQVINNQVDNGTGTAVYAFAPVPVFNPNTPTTLTYVSWQGMNDISARPVARGAPFALTTKAGGTGNSIVLNSLADLTNRENRFAAPRFADDFATINAPAVGGTVPTFTIGPDGLSDDQNNDNVNDFYPTLYPNAFFPAAGTSAQLIFETNYPNVSRAGVAVSSNVSTSLMAFPYIFPGAYSAPQGVSADQFGWIHSPIPQAIVFSSSQNVSTTLFENNPLSYLQNVNHNQVDVGDNLPNYTNIGSATNAGPLTGNSLKQTWWGFPTWRETLSPSWNDPTRQVNDNSNFGNFGQPAGLTPRVANANPTDDADLLPPMGTLLLPAGFNYTALRQNAQQPDCDGYGETSAFMGGSTFKQQNLWAASWEDDLIMTGVRSFDIKAYDNALGAYADLGWGDDVRLLQGAVTWANANFITNVTGAPFFGGNPDYSWTWTGNPAKSSAFYPPLVQINGTYVDYLNYSFAHEGRTPPLIEDNRLDAQYPNLNYIAFSQPFNIPLGTSFQPQYGNVSDPTTGGTDSFTFINYSSNIGDDNNGTIRLRRVWDSWSTDYTQAPANGVYNNPNRPDKIGGVVNPNADPLNGAPWGPKGGTPPIYPSYPPPYPAALRGIQIQIRVVDPTNQKIKSLTIREDFTDKL